MGTLIALWKLVWWIRRQKKQMERDVDAYLTEERAMIWRRNAEKVFRALETGNGNFKDLPTPLRWFFKMTTAENRVGKFGQQFLKSNKLAVCDDELDQPLYPCH